VHAGTLIAVQDTTVAHYRQARGQQRADASSVSLFDAIQAFFNTLPIANVGFTFNAAVTGDFYPDRDNHYSLGRAAQRWSQLYAVTASFSAVTAASLATQGPLRLYEPAVSGTNYTEIQAQAQAANIAYTLPATQGAAGTILQNNGSGVLSWSGAGVGDVVGPAGAVLHNVPIFADTTGKVLADSGLTLSGTNTGDETAARIRALGFFDVTNDGASCGLDADLLDGNHAAAFAAAAHTHSYQPLDTQLTDLAALSYASNALKVLRVNAAETGWELATVSAGVSDGDKGDITVTGSGATWTIHNSVVSLAKMADMATASLIYRKTAGSGVPEVNTLATLKTDLGLTGTNSGDITLAASADVLLALTGQALSFDTQTATYVLAGPASGSPAAVPTFRALAATDIPALAYAPTAGSSSIVTVGTITSGTWTGTDVAVTDGGTGASDAATARTNLGLAIGSNVQAWDTQLDSLAALAYAGNGGKVVAVKADVSGFELISAGDMTLAGTQSVTGAKTFDSSALKMKESGGGADVITFAAPSIAGAVTLTWPSATGTIALTSGNITGSAASCTGNAATATALAAAPASCAAGYVSGGISASGTQDNPKTLWGATNVTDTNWTSNTTLADPFAVTGSAYWKSGYSGERYAFTCVLFVSQGIGTANLKIDITPTNATLIQAAAVAVRAGGNPPQACYWAASGTHNLTMNAATDYVVTINGSFINSAGGAGAESQLVIKCAQVTSRANTTKVKAGSYFTVQELTIA